MSILVRFAPSTLTEEQYDESIRRLEAEATWPPDGLDLHVCFAGDGAFRVSEVWDSPEQFEKFGATLMPILEDIGIVADAPEIVEVHNVVKR